MELRRLINDDGDCSDNDTYWITSILSCLCVKCACYLLYIYLASFFLFLSVRKTHIQTRSSEVIACASDLQLKKQTFSPLLGLNIAALNTSTDELR